MLVFSSLHVHEGAVSQAEKECTDCIHHRSSDGRLPSKNCHAHLTQTATWAHDCVLCQFLTLTMLTAAAAAVTVYIHVCKLSYSQPLCSHHAACCGNIVTRGPPNNPLLFFNIIWNFQIYFVSLHTNTDNYD
jgi:hypothetical protein